MTAMLAGAVAMQPKMAEGASLFRPTLAWKNDTEVDIL
jgi:hypothetical protein